MLESGAKMNQEKRDYQTADHLFQRTNIPLQCQSRQITFAAQPHGATFYVSFGDYFTNLSIHSRAMNRTASASMMRSLTFLEHFE